MKNKIIGIFVCMLMIMTGVLPIVGSDTKTINYVVEEQDCGCGQYNDNLQPIEPIELSPKPTPMTDLPEYFNWMDYEGQDWTTPAKDQENCGSCSAFAAMGALESIINIKEQCSILDLDLSEQYILSCLPKAVGCYRGGWSNLVFKYILSNDSSGNYCNGIIAESCFPYQAIDAEGYDLLGRKHDPILCDEKCENWQESLIPIADYGTWKPNGGPEDRDKIKTQIIESGPVATYMMATHSWHGKNNLYDWMFLHNDPNEYYPYVGSYTTINHVVVIVGWKNDASIGNGGYWIVKNSWGPECGYNGFFNIEYGSLNIDRYQIDWVEYDPAQVNKWRPIANAGGTYQGMVGAEIAFDASGSIDHEGEIVSYAWNFGDGTTSLGKTVNHKYTNKGIFPVKLTVTDNDSATSEDTTWAYIETSNAPPDTPTIKGKRIGIKGAEYQITISATDPDEDEIYYFINWDDWPSFPWYGPYPSGVPITVNHTYINNATFNIKVKAFDPYDAKSAWGTLPVTMPYSYNPMQQFLELLFQRFPNAFSLLRQLIGGK